MKSPRPAGKNRQTEESRCHQTAAHTCRSRSTTGMLLPIKSAPRVTDRIRHPVDLFEPCARPPCRSTDSPGVTAAGSGRRWRARHLRRAARGAASRYRLRGVTWRSSDSMCPVSFVRSWNAVLNAIDVDADVAERVVLRRRRLLHEEVALAVPEHGVGAGPADDDVLPEAGGERRLDVVVEPAGRPLLVRLARRIRVGRLTVEVDVPAGRSAGPS